ncbi:MAG: thioredoxin family protein [Candidatus Anstonellales archaeon]
MVLTESKYILKNGERAPSFELRGIDGRLHKLEDYVGSNALLIVFMCNHCPYVRAKIRKIVELHKKYLAQGLAVVGINPNSNNPNYPDDSFENMKKFASEYGIMFDYLADDDQEVAKKYGAVCTPDPFLFDKNLRLVYHGRVDGDHGKEKGEGKSELDIAIEELIRSGKVDIPQKPSMGCSIKWKG